MPSGAYAASLLRHELCVRNRTFALQHGLVHVESYGGMPVIVYEPTADGMRHGNFLDESYAAILSRPDWRRRLDKVHAQATHALPKCDRRWRELDSSMSSDALLMNIFCYPGVAESAAVRSLLGVDTSDAPQFGFKARVPLKDELVDRTEVDMRFGDLLVEAKLTESDFQIREAAVVFRYRDFEDAFEVRMLPRIAAKSRDGSTVSDPKAFASYQLLRNVLAAHSNGSSFCVFLDARRPDLLEAWYNVMRCVRRESLRSRCKVLTWQELCPALPPRLKHFLNQKYGIVAPGLCASPAGSNPELAFE